MSTACSRLLNIVKTRKSVPITASKTLIPKCDHPISIKDLHQIIDLDQFASKFKQKAIESNRFRKRNNIYDFAIARLADANRHSLIEDILETHKTFKEITGEGYAVRIICLYGNAGMFDHAHKLFDEMPELKCERTVMSFNALLSAGVKSKRFSEVYEIFREYPSKLSIAVDVVSYNTVIHAVCEMGSLSEAMSLLDEMKTNGLRPSVITYNTLLDAFYKKRGFLGGERLWAMMDEDNVCRNIRSYNLTLEALVDQGQLSTALIVFDVLSSEGLNPNLTSFNVFIKGYCDQGNVEEGKKWYNALLESGHVPNRMTFAALVPELCRVGECELAFDLSKKMFKRQFVVDEALLQLVINELVRRSMIVEAKELVELGKTNNFVQYNLALHPETDKLS
ncbi:hypothetical protein RND81_10G019200 [Saponaria officinalis]|uniref:Pentatricopeptide repeat-containing protein n=1 Tax=Saponaria officinalis TaxID=3572 RepID=A0AAW1HY83_SAPOF